jgi:hypothetical protein
VRGVDTAIASRVTAAALPVPGRLAADLVASLGCPMLATGAGLRDLVADPPGGLVGVADAVARALSSRQPKPVGALADPHHLADSDPMWAGGDALRLRRFAATLTPAIARPGLRLVNAVPRPLAGALRTGLDMLTASTPKGRLA